MCVLDTEDIKYLNQLPSISLLFIFSILLVFAFYVALAILELTPYVDKAVLELTEPPAWYQRCTTMPTSTLFSIEFYVLFCVCTCSHACQWRSEDNL